MNQISYLVVFFACFAICRVISSNVSENPSQNPLVNQRLRTSTDEYKIQNGNWTTLSETLDIFNVRYLANNWTEGKYPIQEQCAKDITRYIEGLRKQEVWASKGMLNQSNLFY